MTDTLKKTPFHAIHVKNGAMMVDFGGWHMPVRYAGDLKEHHTVRENVGVFDVSHMGEILIEGEGALELLQYTTCNDVSLLEDGQIQYNALMTSDGCFIDDILIYRRGSQKFFVVVNASNQDKDFEWFQKHNTFGAQLTFASENYAQLAVQGPHAVNVIEAMTEIPVREMKYYHFAEGLLSDIPALVSRTGYTASDGFELYFHPKYAGDVWKKLMEHGQAYQIAPCGLGARDSLRIEGKMALYGNDIGEHTTVLEASLGWIVKLNKQHFLGRERLAEQKEQGLTRKLVGFEMIDRGIARHGYPVSIDEKAIGEVTSGVRSPTLGKSIGMAYVAIEHSKIGTEFDIEIRGKHLKAVVVKTPFYKIQR